MNYFLTKLLLQKLLSFLNIELEYKEQIPIEQTLDYIVAQQKLLYLRTIDCLTNKEHSMAAWEIFCNYLRPTWHEILQFYFQKEQRNPNFGYQLQNLGISRRKLRLA